MPRPITKPEHTKRNTHVARPYIVLYQRKQLYKPGEKRSSKTPWRVFAYKTQEQAEEKSASLIKNGNATHVLVVRVLYSESGM